MYIVWKGYFLVIYMQTLPPSLLKESLFFICWSKMPRNVLKRMKNQFSNFGDLYFLDLIVQKLKFFIHLAKKKEYT